MNDGRTDVLKFSTMSSSDNCARSLRILPRGVQVTKMVRSGHEFDCSGHEFGSLRTRISFVDTNFVRSGHEFRSLKTRISVRSGHEFRFIKDTNFVRSFRIRT